LTGYRIVDHPIFLKWNSEPTEIISYEWDFTSDGIYDYVETTNNAPDGDFDGKTIYIYGDDGVYTATLRITDETGATDTDTCNVTVNNVAPSIIDMKAVITEVYADITLRLSGEKWHDATMYLYEDGIEMSSVTVVRFPGSPDEQSATIEDVHFNSTREYSAKVVYTPEDDPVNGQPNGANSAWIILTFEDESEKRIHHTFNVKHPDTWKWNVELNQYIMNEIIIEATAIDLGSDDLTFNWSFGSSTTYYNDGVGPDPYPSPDGIFPFEAKDVMGYVYTGSTVISLIVSFENGTEPCVPVVLYPCIFNTTATFLSGSPFDPLSKIPMIATSFFGDLIFNSFYGFFRDRNKLVWLAIIVVLGYAFMLPFFVTINMSLFYNPQVLNLYLSVYVLLLPVTIVETIIGALIGTLIYKRINK